MYQQKRANMGLQKNTSKKWARTFCPPPKSAPAL